MRLLFLLIAAILSSTPATAQPRPASPADHAGSPPQDAPASDLPVSLDRIRDGLSKPADTSLLRGAELPPDFRIEIVEQHKIDQMLSNIKFKSEPVPAGGLYGYEQQQRLFRPTDRPLMQPYAAFNGGQLITVALENLIGKYLGGRAIDSVTGAERTRSERAARAEVDENIATYCASRPDRDRIQLCTSDAPDR